MLEQIDHRGKRFTISGNRIVGDAADERCRQANSLKYHVQQDHYELKQAKAVAGPAGLNPDIEVLER